MDLSIFVPKQDYASQGEGEASSAASAAPPAAPAAPEPEPAQPTQSTPAGPDVGPAPEFSPAVHALGEHFKRFLHALQGPQPEPEGARPPAAVPSVASVPAPPTQPADSAGNIHIPQDQNTAVYSKLDPETEHLRAPDTGTYTDSSRADPFHHMLASLAGIPVSVARAFGDIESQNKPNLGTNKFGYTGLYQQGRENIPKGWTGDLRDASFNAAVTAHTLKTNTDFFRNHMQREPDAAEQYMMHNQGLVGGTALVSAAEKEPGVPAYQALSKYAPLVGGRKMSEGVALAHIKENMWGPLSKLDPKTVTAQQWVDGVRKGVNDRVGYYQNIPEGEVQAVPTNAVQVPSRRLDQSFLRAAPTRAPKGKQPFVPPDRLGGI